MLDEKTWSAVEYFLDNYVDLQEHDQVIVCYATDSKEPAAWLCASIEERGIAYQHVWMATLHDPGIENRLQLALPDPESLSGRVILITLERDTMSHNDVFRASLARYPRDRCLVFRAISACNNLFSGTLSVSPKLISAINTSILEKLMGAKRLRITTAGGSDLDVTLDNEKYRWVSNRGIWSPGKFVMLPAGEVATFPASIDGTFVADFAFNVNAMTDLDARLEICPVSVKIKDGRAVDVYCSNPINQNFLEECFTTYCAHIVGELGFGTNPGVDEAISLNSHINERRPGIHLGFGDHNQLVEVAGYSCPIHLDLIARGGLVWFDDVEEPIDMEKISPSINPHPKNYNAEDLKSPEASEMEDLEIDDCCGILRKDGFQLFALNNHV